jgi:biopolymer transport protein TolR
MALSMPSLPASSRGRRQIGTSLSEINVTPLVDVMLVLLIIFMVTAPMMQSGIGVNLPQAETDSAPADEGLTLTITKDQYIHIGESTININLLERRIQEYFLNKPRKVVYIKADQDLPFRVIVRIMDITKKAGVEVLGIVTDPIDARDLKDKKR